MHRETRTFDEERPAIPTFSTEDSVELDLVNGRSTPRPKVKMNHETNEFLTREGMVDQGKSLAVDLHAQHIYDIPRETELVDQVLLDCCYVEQNVSAMLACGNSSMRISPAKPPEMSSIQGIIVCNRSV